MSKIKRWDFVGGDGPGAYPQEEPDGRMVAYTDHVAAMGTAQSELATITQDAWEAAGGNPGIKATRDELLSALRLMNEADDEHDAMQQRLTAADERADVLEGLIGEVLDAVGREPLDLDAVLRLRARMRAALKPAEAPRNQCDGCQAGIPLINGTHRMGREGGYPDFMGCSAKLYKPAEGGGDVARLALRPENQRITPARFKCLACGEYHEGSGNLPCPSMSPYSRIEQ